MKNIKVLIFVFLSTLIIINNSYAVTGKPVDDGIANSDNVKTDISTMKKVFNSLNTPDFDSSEDVPIDFNSVTWSHPNADIGTPNTSTYVEALNLCESLNWIDTDKNIRQPESFTSGLAKYQFWVACMKSFTPFLESQNIDSVSCSAIPVSNWGGNCTGNVPNGSDFDITRVSHNSDNSEYQGYANYECKNGKWLFLDGFCMNDPDVCENAIDVSWPVTSPDWAVLGNSSEGRYDPKPDCGSRVEGTFLSGTLIGGLTSGIPNVPLESPPMNPVDRTSYDPILSTENTYFRCFNGEWALDNPETAICVYQPKSCSQQSYTTADGCQFNIPDISHGADTTVTSPFPVNSTGSVAARCFDGDIEILSESCQLSCLNESRNSLDWDSEFSNDPEDCTHPSLPINGSRTSPGSVLSIENTNTLMTGQYSWKCEDGFFQFEGSACQPRNCDADIPANSYVGADTLNSPVQNNTCNHNAWTDGFEHNSTISLAANDPSHVGSKYYSCSYGTISSSSSYPDTCVIQRDFFCLSNQPLFPDPAYTVSGPSVAPSCEINCRNINGGLDASCRQECTPNPICDCNSPCGQTGEELSSSGGSCSYDAVCSSDSTSLCNFNDGTEFVTESCNGSNWVTSSTRCEPYETPLNYTNPQPASATGCSAGQSVNWTQGLDKCTAITDEGLVGENQNVEAFSVEGSCDLTVLDTANGNNAVISCGNDGSWSVVSSTSCSCP
jgi:hypothetical protein